MKPEIPLPARAFEIGRHRDSQAGAPPSLANELRRTRFPPAQQALSSFRYRRATYVGPHSADSHRRTCRTIDRSKFACNGRICRSSETMPCGLLGSQTVVSSRDELDKSPVTQILKLLSYLRLDVLVSGIEITQLPLESIHLVQREVAFPKGLHAFHYVEQPAARLRRF